jgi:DMSO/TMAO reductase YedYZ molybdopterin-dependent catalytic subunit
MQVLKRHKTAAIITVLFIAVVIAAFFVSQNIPIHNSNPSPNPSPSIASSQSPKVTSTPPKPPQATSTLAPIATPTPTLIPINTPRPIPQPTPITLYPGEVLQYQGQNLDPIRTVYENAIAGTQYINQSTYKVTIEGLVNNVSTFTYDHVVSHQSYQKVVTIYCVEGWHSTILWDGILLKDLLNETGIAPGAKVIIFYASDGYSTSLPLDYILQNNIILAYKMNGVPLTPELGWPFMLVAQSQYGYKWIKWITEINVSNDTTYLGYWESRGYPNNAPAP